eukprot:gene3897-7110_t
MSDFEELIEEVHKKDKESLKIIHGFVLNIFTFNDQPSQKISVTKKNVQEHIVPVEPAIRLMEKLKFMSFKNFEKVYSAFNEAMKKHHTKQKLAKQEEKIRSIISRESDDPKEEDFTEEVKATAYGRELYQAFKHNQQSLDSFCEAFLINDIMSSIQPEEFKTLSDFVQKNSSNTDFYVIVFVFRMAIGNPAMMKQTLGYFDFLVAQKTAFTLHLLKLKASYSLNLYAEIGSKDDVLSEFGMAYMQIRDYKKSFKYLTDYVNKSEWCEKSRVNAHYKLAYHYLCFEEDCDSPKNPEKNCESFIFHMRCGMIAENYQLPVSNPFNSSTDQIASFCFNQYLLQSENICNFCGKKSKTKCSICYCAWYCSEECQKEDWKTHKLMCISHEKPMKMTSVIEKGECKSEFQRLMQLETNKTVQQLSIKCIPKLKLRFEKILETIGEPTKKQ